QTYLDRIERLNPVLRAYRVVLADSARVEAAAAQKRLDAGERRPLLGVPVAIKDDVDVAGEVTTMGTGAHGGPKAHDAVVVRRLREAGAVILGKTTCSELCIWPFTETPTFGATRNPWDLQRTPGGSSGGTGAAVAAGLVGAALGSDGGGSIRIPSAWCGLFGLKPQRGRVSMSPRAESWHGLSVNGVLTRTVADTALFLDVAAGSTPVDRDRPEPPSQPFSQFASGAPGRLRIAYSTRIPPPGLQRLDADCARAVAETVDLLRSLGHEVVEQDPDYGFDTGPLFLARMLRGIYDEARSTAHPERLARRTRAMARIGGMVPVALLERARAAEHAVSERLNGVLAAHDVLLTPTTAQPPSSIGQYDGRGALWTLNAVIGRVPFNAPWNYTGQPAASVPAGFGADGLPRGVQIVGRDGDEGTLLALAAQIETERPWAERRPALFS
ncbi:MAG: amidase, partial [Solirubrobacteraceae bacterium]